METRVRSGVGLTVMLIAGLSFPSALLHAEILNCTNVLEYKPDPAVVAGKKIIPLPNPDEDKTVYDGFLRDRFGFQAKDITWGKKYPMVIHGGDETSFAVKADFMNPTI